MINRGKYGLIELACDACGEVRETKQTEFMAAWPAAKEEGWRARKVANEWLHFCPDPACKP